MADQKTIAVHDVPGYGTIHFPADMSPEEIQKRIAELPSAQAIKPVKDGPYYGASRERFEEPSYLERIGHGAQRTIDRVSQLWMAAGEKLGAYEPGLGQHFTDMVNKEEGEYQKNRQGAYRARGEDPPLDVPSVIGSVGMTSPLALLPGGQSYWGAAGWGAGAGAAEGFLQFDPSYSAKGTLQNTAVGAATGGVAAPVARGVAELGSNFLRKGMGRFKGVMERTKGAADPQDLLREVPELGMLPVENRAALILEAQNQIKATGALNVEQLARKANLIANDVTPTKSMVTRNPRDWSMERNMQKLSQSPDDQIASLGQELTGVYQANDAALTTRLNRFSENLPSGTQEALGMEVMRGLDDVSKLTQKDVSALYEMVRRQHGDLLASDARKLYSTLEDLRDNTYAEKLVSSVTNKLKRFGMVDKDGNLTSNSLTVNQAEELRKFVNTLPNDFGKRDIIKAIDSDVMASTGDDFFSAARAAAAQRKGLLENPATQRALNAFGEITQGKTSQNFIKANVVDGAEQDVRALIDTLGTLPREQAETAMNAMRAGVLDFLQSKAVNPDSNKFSGVGLSKAIRQIGDDKLKLILGEKGFQELKSLARAGVDATYEPAYAAVNHANTAPTLLAWTQRARAVPGVPLIVNEGAERGAARLGYGQQLGEILAARSDQPLPQLSERTRALIGLIRNAGAPSAAATLSEKRKESR